MTRIQSFFALFISLSVLAAPAEVLDLQKFEPAPAPQAHGLQLKKGDRLAICGDSITEQRMYSRLIEDYLTMCVPQLRVTVRQFGWSGEKAPGFLARMTNDCLRFKPTIATTCYGMNDHQYRPYEDQIGNTYRQYSAAIDEAFKANGVRVIEGSAGCVSRVPGWGKAGSSLMELDQSLCRLRNIGIEVARRENVGFADVFWPMLAAGTEAQKRYDPGYAIAGRDGVHPGWAGHAVMAYAFLRAMGLDGDLGTFAVDLKRGKMKVPSGHKLLAAGGGKYEIQSSRYPFCGCVPAAQPPPVVPSYPICAQDNPASDSSIQSAMTLIPFNQELNRLLLVATNGDAAEYTVTWGSESKNFTSEQLARGINLAAEFPANPFGGAFSRVDAAIAAKQAFETRQIKQDFRSPEAKADMKGVVAKTEKERAPLVAAVKAAFVPVTYTLVISPAQPAH